MLVTFPLPQENHDKVILIQPEVRKRRKTDRRDAAALSELLRVNRTHFLQGKPIRGLRQVDIASTSDQETRWLTRLIDTSILANDDLPLGGAHWE